jgi:hypothetical protein
MPLVLILLLLAQEEPELTPPEKQVHTLVARIRRLASAEAVVYGIDTRIKIAEALTAKYPKLAMEVARDARAALPGVTIAPEQNNLRVRLVHTLAGLDIVEAERLTRSFSPRTAEDYLAQAYDQLYLARPSREIVSRGFAAGALRMVSASRLLDEQKDKDPEATVALFSELIGAYPAESAGPKDVLFLLREARAAARWNLPLALEGIDKALNGLEELPADAAAIIDTIDPGLVKRYHLRILAKLEEQKEPEREASAASEGLEKLPFADALEGARKISELTDRTLAFIALSRREELSPQQRTSLASEAFTIAGKVPFGEDRLYLIAMISRDFARRGEMSRAGLTAQLLLETYNKVCDCQASVCESGKDKIACLEHVGEFADYLDEFKITPESMNLENISLDARLLVLQLKSLVGAK